MIEQKNQIIDLSSRKLNPNAGIQIQDANEEEYYDEEDYDEEAIDSPEKNTFKLKSKDKVALNELDDLMAP